MPTFTHGKNAASFASSPLISMIRRVPFPAARVIKPIMLLPSTGRLFSEATVILESNWLATLAKADDGRACRPF